MSIRKVKRALMRDLTKNKVDVLELWHHPVLIFSAPIPWQGGRLHAAYAPTLSWIITA